ncbi:MAG: translation initiation factor IF-2 [Candidatus Omnitrophota bacterium]
MRVSDLAKELGVNSDVILAKLKSLHLKAKDSKQEINDAVMVVLRRELGKGIRVSPKTKAVEKSEPAAKISAKEKKIKPEPVKKAESKAVSKSKKSEKEEKPKKTSKFTKVITEKKAAKSSVKASEKTVPTAKTLPPVKESPAAEKPHAVLSEKETAQVDKKIVEAPPKQEAPKAFVSKPFPPRFDPRARRPAFVDSKPKPEIKEEPIKQLGELEIQIPISVKDLAFKIQQKPGVVLKHLLQMGVFANINQALGEEVIQKLSTVFGFTLSKVKTQEEQLLDFHQVPEDPALLKPRSPVVTFMGHVDHGKTSLLDKIRKSKVVDREHGGITQHIGAYSVNIAKGKITFLDTPGHEAFTSMRARGALITDLVVLVVAADEGIMPQTEEAINHARAANVPIIVALSKIDKRNADVDRIKKELADHGLMSEDWGGKTIVVGVSAVTGEGIDTLLEMILLEAEVLELKANHEKKASGIVVEAQLSHNRGPVATVIVQNGTLRENDIVIVGPHSGRIKAMFDDRERSIKEAGPAQPAEILGLSGVPEAGDMFYAVDDEKQAKEIVSRRQAQIKNQKMQPISRVTLEDLSAQIQAGKIKELNVIIKADVQGSLEALKVSLEKIPSDEVKLKFIHIGIGEINASDVILAGASNAIIIGFHVEAETRAKEELEKRPVDIRTYRIIYDAINDVKNALSGLLEPKTKKKTIGRVDIRQVFNLSRSGIVAGCFVAKGKVHRKANIDILRNGDPVFSGTISSIKRFKDDVREVTEGFECGITINGFTGVEPGDVMEVYELEKIARTL